jgi:hypothetical protein
MNFSRFISFCLHESVPFLQHTDIGFEIPVGANRTSCATQHASIAFASGSPASMTPQIRVTRFMKAPNDSES